MKIYVYQTYKTEKKNGVTNMHLISEGVLDHAEDIFVEKILPLAENDTSDRSLWDMQEFLNKNYPGYVFRYQEQEIDFRLSTEKAIKGLHPQMDDDIRNLGSGVLLAPATYAAIIIGSTVKDMRGRAEAIASLLKYFNITTKDLEITKAGCLDNKEKFSWEQ